MSDLFESLSFINEHIQVHLLNSFSANYKKQELIVKLWLILGIDTKKMCRQLVFCGIDAGIIDKKEAFRFKEVLLFGRLPSYLPELRDEDDTNIAVHTPCCYKENGWKVFRLFRRLFDPKDSRTFYFERFDAIFDDDVEILRKNKVKKNDRLRKSLLCLSAYLGAEKCFKYLHSNSEITPEVIQEACCSGNPNIIRLIQESGNSLTDRKYFYKAVEHWNNDLAMSILDKIDGKSALIEAAIKSCNFKILSHLFSMGADVEVTSEYKYNNDACL